METLKNLNITKELYRKLDSSTDPEKLEIDNGSNNGINPLTAIEEYDAIYHQEDTLKPDYIERRNKERAEKAKKRQRKTQK